MSGKYKVRDQNYPHFITLTVVKWLKCFEQKRFSELFIDCLKYCQSKKGLTIYAWCIMPNHVHMIVKAYDGFKLESIIRDLKRHTSIQFHKILTSKQNAGDWKLEAWYKILKTSDKSVFTFWQSGFHPIELSSNFLIDQKLDYIHSNPVKAGIIECEEYYPLSSAMDYYGVDKGRIDIEFLE